MSKTIEWTTEELLVDELVFDDKFQHRADLPSLEDYSESLLAAEKEWIFPPIKVAKVRGKHYVIDGFTRGRAAAKVELEKIPCKVATVGEAKAFELSLGSNAEHGYRRTNRDKRMAVEHAIGRWPKKSASELSRICKVSRTYIYNVISDLKEQEEQDVMTEDAEREREAVEEQQAANTTKQPEAAQESEETLVEGEPCEVCTCIEYSEHEDGLHCAVCGWNPSTKQEAEPVAVSSDEFSEEPGSNGEVQLARKRVKPGKSANAVDLDKEEKRKARAAFGAVIRYFESVGKAEEMKQHLDAIHGVLV